MKKLNPTLVLALCTALAGQVAAQCYNGNPSGNNPTFWVNSLSIEDQYTAARRWEETDRGLTANCLGDMVAPPGGWGSLTDDEVALYIHNSERAARGFAPIYGVETTLDNVTQAHSDWQCTNDVFNHSGDPAYGTNMGFQTCPDGTWVMGSTPSQRVNSEPSLVGCHQTVGENISIVATNSTNGSSFQNFVARRIYGWIYADAGSGWGHRVNVFLTFNDDYGDPGNEGFIGVGVGVGTSYQAYNVSACNSYANVRILTVKYYDPAGSCSGFSFNAVLPVELVAFSAEPNENGQVKLLWKTASQQNSDYFQVERSADGKDFQSLGRVTAAGFSNSPLSYRFMDGQPFPGNNYYRLRQVDFDGRQAFSNMVATSIGLEPALHFYPNPATSEINLSLPGDGSSVTDIALYDCTGQPVLTFRPNDDGTEFMLPVGHLPPGAYWLAVRDIAGRQLVQKVIKR